MPRVKKTLRATPIEPTGSAGLLQVYAEYYCKNKTVNYSIGKRISK